MDNLMKLNRKMYELLATSAAKSIQYLDGDERKNLLNQLRGEVAKLCTLEEQAKRAARIKQSIEETYNTGEATEEENDNLIKDYKSKLSEIAPDVSSNQNLLEFDRIVVALENDADGKDGAVEGGEDAELQLTRNTVNVIDPITKKRMIDPVKNDICGHVYDRDSVEALIGVNAHTRCPVPGCKNKQYLSMSNMRSDIVTRTYLQKHQA